MAPVRSALNAISVAPRPGRRLTVKPRASSSCANISASRYDSPNGLEATMIGLDLEGWPDRCGWPGLTLSSERKARGGPSHARITLARASSSRT